MEKNIEQDLYNKSIELLARREHSQTELREKLQRKFNCNQSQIEPVLDRLLRQGYQSDERFAVAFTRSRLFRGLGKRRVLQELKLKGISADLAEQAFAEESQDDLASDALIEQTWRKKFKALPEDQKERAKQYRFLQYRGFSGDEVNRLFNKLKNE